MKTIKIGNNINIENISIESYFDRQNEPYKRRNKLYIGIANETLLENIENRRLRPYTIWKKEVIPIIINWLKDNMPNHYSELKNSKWHWKQNCGCDMCPCSPGFISDNEGQITISVYIK